MTPPIRNVDVPLNGPLDEWPMEALLTLVERGSLSDWRRIAISIDDLPWGPTARNIDAITSWGENAGVDDILRARLDAARSHAALAGRRRYADRIRALRKATGLSMREFAAEVGTSASRLSDYEHAKVSPTTDVLARIESVSERLSSPTAPVSREGLGRR